MSHAPKRRIPRPRWGLLPAILSMAGVVPPMALAVYSLFEPWARARVMFLWGISRNPDATLLVLLTLAGTVAASFAAVTRGRRLLICAAVHLVMGALMCVVSWLAYRMVLQAGVRAFGLVPLAAVHPGRGLQLFLLAALLVVGLGLVELGVVLLLRRRGSRVPDRLAGAPAEPRGRT